MTQNIADLIRELEKGHFYGSLELKYENGRLVLVRKSETYKPMEKPDEYDNNRAR